jgi:hypothetical protein
VSHFAKKAEEQPKRKMLDMTAGSRSVGDPTELPQ